MGGRLLDTSVIVEVLRSNAAIVEFLGGIGNDIYIPAIVIGELLYGANKSAETEHNTEMVHKFTNKAKILAVDADVAEYYAQIKNDLLKTGIKIPENDLWIAAIAKKYGLALVTFDNHFKHINNLETIGIE